jgi:lipid II:glycine glycyltransferase (peptidoglycan interpeptide bridge formation enzyme)
MAETDYNVQVSDQLEDSEWDTFVEKTPGGHHVQTSLWAQLKASLGWRNIRIIIRQKQGIVGGAQLLIRRAPLIGSLGYVTKGPVLAMDDTTLEDILMEHLHQVCKANKVRYLIVQPPSNRQDLSGRMSNWGFNETLLPITPTPYTTVLIDLTKDLQYLLSKMRSATRRNIRLAERRGIVVRDGTEQELKDFYQALMATANRQNFKEYPEEYWNLFYKIFSAHGKTKILFATYKEEIVSTLLLVNFGDTVIYKKGGWTGNYRDLHPNELLHWEAIQWAKSQGHRYYDFEGIEPEAAIAIQQNGLLPKHFEATLTWFKLGLIFSITLFCVGLT